MSSKRAAFLIPVLLVTVAGLLRVVHLHEPVRIIFDETYYVNDARAYLEHGVEEGFAVHPPVGKWLIAAGIAAAGDHAFGWRIAGAIAGTLVVLFTYLLGARLLRWRGAAALAALLAAVDGLLFVQARTSMLDVFLGLLVVLGAWLLLVDHDRTRLDEPGHGGAPLLRAEHPHLPGLTIQIPAGGSADRPPPVATVAAEPVTAASPQSARADLPPRGHGFRWLAGAAFGLAVATKWSGGLALVAAGLVVLGWELAWRRRMTGRARTGGLRLAGSLVGTFLLLPAVLYLASYVPWLVNYAHTTEGETVCTRNDQPVEPCHVSIPGRLRSLYRYQVATWRFHANLKAEHPYRAPAYTWPVLGRPVAYYWESCTPERARGVVTTDSEGKVEKPEPCVVAQGNAAEIIALGNPALWWVALPALLPLAAGAVRRDRRAWYLISFWGVQYVPWLLVSRPVFFFYMTPVVPFLAVTVAYGAVWLDEGVERRARRRGRPLRQTRLTPGAVTGALVALAAVALFVYFYPVYAGLELDYDAVRQRWWFDAWR